jgi:phosphohistidine phosphatase SixA
MMRCLTALLVLVLPSSVGASEPLWDLLAGGGQVVLLRHATTTPGVGDPPGFRVEECASQRNLSGAGRDEARRLGAAFRARNIPVGRVLSSRFCRCLETAHLRSDGPNPIRPSTT